MHTCFPSAILKFLRHVFTVLKMGALTGEGRCNRMGSEWRKWVVFGSMSALGPKERKDRESLLREPYRCRTIIRQVGFPAGSDCKESACNVRDLGSMPGLGRFPGEGNGYPLQYSGLENSRD